MLRLLYKGHYCGFIIVRRGSMFLDFVGYPYHEIMSPRMFNK